MRVKNRIDLTVAKKIYGNTPASLSNGAPRASPWSPKTIPTYAKASVGHPPVSETRRSMID